MKTCAHTPKFSEGAEVRVGGITEHVPFRMPGKVIRILPNPSGQAEHQWYDVRFPDGAIGRFLERHLSPSGVTGENRAA